MRDVEISLDFESKLIREKLDKIGRQSRAGEMDIRKQLRKAVEVWSDQINGGTMYRHVVRRTGSSQNPMGQQTGYSKIKGEYWAKTRPKARRKGMAQNSSGSWRAHFFATPAITVPAYKKVPFNAYYMKANPTVIRTAIKNIASLILRYFNNPF